MTYQRVNIRYAGKAQDAAYRTVIFDTTGFDVFSVTVIQNEATWATAVLNVRDSNNRTGTFSDFETAVTLTASDKSSGLLGVRAQFVVIDITTGEGSDAWVDISINGRRSQIGQAVGL
jgi:hypothetical protein